MNKESIILIWTTIITVVLLVWIRFDPAYSSDSSIKIKTFSKVELSTQDVESLKKLTR